MISSRLSIRRVSTDMRLVSIGINRKVASRITPVSPIPPTVAQNSSGSRSGPISTTVVSASISRRRVTCVPNEPSRWWFLPWMSLAIAPPIVTKRVPGVTGTNQPRGTMMSSRSSRLTPADTVTVPAASSIRTASWGGLQPQDVATPVLGRVAVRAAEAAGDPAPVGQVLDRRRQPGLVDLDQFGGARRRPPPSREQRPPRRVGTGAHDAETLQSLSTATPARCDRSGRAACRARA